MWTSTNPHHFLTTCTWDVLNVNANQRSPISRGCSLNIKSIPDAGLIAGGKESKERDDKLCSSLPQIPGGMRPKKKIDGDSSKPRKIHHQSKWKYSQDAVYWIRLAKAQEKGLTFWQTKVSRHYFSRFSAGVGSDNGEKTLYQRLFTPRPAPKIILKSVWNSQQLQRQQQQQDTMESTGTPVVEQNLGNRNRYNKGSTGTCWGRGKFIPSWSQNSRSSTRCSTWRSRKTVQNSRSGWQVANWRPNRIDH